ncbi:ATP-binding protein [Actinomadura sp. 9N215]|uniref:ATP-binding protein n=1 Tax=Actinomadura sp. 9N215 TaxID=3375150 RepID=UPI003788E57F
MPAIRAFVRGFLIDTPRAYEAESIAAELAANSLQHTPSGEPGGVITVAVSIHPGWARIAVSDTGAGGWSRPAATEALGDYGRGLILVDALADKVGHDVTEVGQTLWAELTWSVEP